MIKQIQLRNFRKHEDLTVNLGEGLQTFKGANEAGKTTILEGMAYALFGSKALRGSLADVATWGRKETELKATVVLETDKLYTFTRSKAGAEVYVDGASQPFVTGQSEVSAFAASLLGADAVVAHHLMLAGQGGLRGVLEQGPKATAGLIETLSDLDLIDRIIEAAQEKLQLGSTSVLTDRLKQAELRLADLEPVPEPAPVDLEGMTAELNKLKGAAEQLAPTAKIAGDLLAAEVGRREERDRLERESRVILDQAEQVAKDIASTKDQIISDLPNLDVLRARLVEYEDYETRAREYRLFQKLPEVVDFHSREEVQSQMTVLKKTRDYLRTSIFDTNLKISKLEGQVSASSTCSACGQDTSHLASFKEKQASIQDELETGRQILRELQLEQERADKDFNHLDDILVEDGAIEKAAAGIRVHAARDYSVIPVRITWNGEAPGDDLPDVERARSRLAEAEAEHKKQAKLQGQLETLNNSLKALAKSNNKIDESIAELNLLSDEEFGKLEEAKAEAEAALSQANGLVAMQQIMLDEAKRQYQDALQGYRRYELEKQTLTDSVEQLRKDIETTEFNNNLVKKIRAARPIIATKLWNLVLTSVSVLFSQMRGEQSIVTRVKDGFLVNGKAVESLSGSTLDILGLAIRCALIKTFVPNCPFLVLDEPSAACDADRSAALVGFVAAAGFKQIIMVTHEEVSDSASANLIAI